MYLASSGVIISRNGSTFGVALVSKTLNLSSLIPPGGNPAFPRVEFTLSGHQPSLEDVRRELEMVELGDWPLKKWEQFLYGVDLSICIWDAIKDTNDNVERKLASNTSGLPDKEQYSKQEIYNFFRVVLINKEYGDVNGQIKTSSRTRTTLVLKDGEVDEFDEFDEFDNAVDNAVDNAESLVKDQSHPDNGRIQERDLMANEWLIVDTGRTIDFIAQKYPIYFIQSLFDIDLLVEHDKINPRRCVVEPQTFHQKLINLTKHELKVETDIGSFEKPFNIYMGYDPKRVDKSESKLFVFSRGRLMAEDNDFRQMLDIRIYEADCQQVIICGHRDKLLHLSYFVLTRCVFLHTRTSICIF